MNIDIELKPGMIIESFTHDYSAIEQFKLEYLDESYLEQNPCTNKYEPLWTVSGRNGTMTRFYFEDEIRNHFWIAGENKNIAYEAWTILKY